MGRPVMDLVLIQRVFDLVGEYTCRQTGDKLLSFVRVRGVKNVIVDQDVVAEESQLQRSSANLKTHNQSCSYLVFHVFEQASD
jgi:hypothetical protein